MLATSDIVSVERKVIALVFANSLEIGVKSGELVRLFFFFKREKIVTISRSFFSRLFCFVRTRISSWRGFVRPQRVCHGYHRCLSSLPNRGKNGESLGAGRKGPRVRTTVTRQP